jgi:predicted nucleic acid-binding Zn ribbon protein
MTEPTNWVGVTPDPPSLQGVVTPGGNTWHYVPTDTASFTVCGASVPHMSLDVATTDPASITCEDCRAYLARIAEVEATAYDCSSEGHLYEMITTVAGDVIAMNCPECGARWKVEREN